MHEYIYENTSIDPPLEDIEADIANSEMDNKNHSGMRWDNYNLSRVKVFYEAELSQDDITKLNFILSNYQDS